MTSTTVTFTPPWLGLFIDNILQSLVDCVALREQVVERRLAEHAPQSGLGDERRGFEEVLHFHDRRLWIDDAEINHRIDRRRHVVACHHLLTLDVDRHDAQIDPHHAVHDRDEEDQSRPFGSGQFPEAKDNAAFVLAQNANHLRQDDDGENDDGYDPSNQPG